MKLPIFLLVNTLTADVAHMMGTTIGNEFILMTPPIAPRSKRSYRMPFVLFSLLAPESPAFQVFVTTPWFKGNGSLHLIVTLHPMVAETITLDKNYLYVLERTSISYISIQVFNSEGPNTITFLLKLTSRSLPLQYLSRSYGDQSRIKITLSSQEGFTMTTCGNSTGDATGTYIYGLQKFGVLTGSCQGRTPAMKCNDNSTSSMSPSFDIVSEMLMPWETFGSEFITLAIGTRISLSYFIVLAGQDYSEVNIYNSEQHPESYVLRKRGDFLMRRLDQTECLVKSNESIQMICVQASTCLGAPGELGDTSLSMLVPTQLFYFKYIFSVNDIFPATHQAIIVGNVAYLEFLYLNESQLDKEIVWHSVSGSLTWSLGSIPLETGTYLLHNTLRQNFGCYLYGQYVNVSFMHPAGYIAASISEVCRTMMHMKAGDLLDNDCDRRIDEELLDNQDNDGDGQLDEDLALLTVDLIKQIHMIEEHNNRKKVDRKWSKWSEWQCSSNCSDSTQYRHRLCDNPKPGNAGVECPGESEETILEQCYLENIVCPAECPDFSWGINCTRTCKNCIHPCDKFTGACQRCGRGYKYPRQGCIKQCDLFEYGEDCLQSCLEKCGDDCVNRETGDCILVVDEGSPESEGWGTWTEWHCAQDCLDSALYRKRVCLSVIACHGTHLEVKSGHCYIGVVCPLDCPKNHWNIDCRDTCSYCEDDCDKFTGRCKACVAGHKYPEEGCHERCGTNQYGVNCEGDCEAKCGHDCINRITGQCQENYLQYVTMVPGLLILVPCYYWLCSKHKSKVNRSYSFSFVKFLSIPRLLHRLDDRYGSSVDKEEWLPTSAAQSSSTTANTIKRTATLSETNESPDSSDFSDTDISTSVFSEKRSKHFETYRSASQASFRTTNAGAESNFDATNRNPVEGIDSKKNSGTAEPNRFRGVLRATQQKLKKLAIHRMRRKDVSVTEGVVEITVPEEDAIPKEYPRKKSSLTAWRKLSKASVSKFTEARRESKLEKSDLEENKAISNAHDGAEIPRKTSSRTDPGIYIGD
ncbi:uncharacterized protein LOC106075918 [Biomphalaria glabrata]|uniref:Uncharacterized protein LOC106075918 n=1 Tax=Biomphalaria glabrata TaxID=6526 RepID=A0A9W2ZBB6_BIOGL|nr:uncharacterized protein LOC106075918 [Biomphalaria glabrata]